MLDKNDVTRILKESLTGNFESIQKFKKKHSEFHWSELKYPKTGDTVLHMASRNGFIAMIKYLLASFDPPAVDCKNNDSKTSLHEAAQFCQYESAKVLLESGANVNALKRADWTPLMLACTKLQDDSSRLVELLLTNGALVNYRNKDGWTALHLVCREGNLNIFNLLIDHNADINVKTKNGRSILHIASLHGNLDIVREICRKKMDVNEQDSCGNTPVHESILGNHILVCQELLSNGGDVSIKNSADFSLLHLAASQSTIDVIDYVLNELDFDVNDANNKGFTSLHCAARKNRKDVYDFLVGRGAKEDIRDSFGRTANEYLALEPC